MRGSAYFGYLCGLVFARCKYLGMHSTETVGTKRYPLCLFFKAAEVVAPCLKKSILPNNLFAKSKSVVGEFEVVDFYLPKFRIHSKSVRKTLEVEFF